MLSRPRRRFLIALGSLFGPPAPATQTGAIATKGRTFLQLSRYDRMPEKYFKPYFEAIDQHYTPAMLKAPGLLRYQRFRHYDLPERTSARGRTDPPDMQSSAYQVVCGVQEYAECAAPPPREKPHASF